MLNVSEVIKSAYKSDEYLGNVSLTIGTNTYNERNILADSTSITESISSGNDIDFRSVEKSCLETTLINITEDIKELKGQQITFAQTILATTVPLGVYTIVDAVNDGDYLYEITAYDNLHKFDVDVSDWWNEEVAFPISLRNLLISLCTKVGVSYNFPATFTNSEFQVERNIFVEETTGVDFLGYIQEVCAGFIKPDRTGTMRLIQLVYQSSEGLYPDVTIYPSDTLYPMSEHDASTATPSILYNVSLTKEKLEIADYEVAPITALQIRGTSDDIGVVVGGGDNVYVIEANPILYSFTGSADDRDVATEILNVISEISYIPVATKVKALPYIEVGDLIRFVSYEGREAYAPLLQRSMTGFLLNSDTITVNGREKRDNTVRSVNKTTKILNRRIHEVINTVSEFSSTIQNIETDINGITADYTSKITQTAEDITSEVTQKLNDYVTEEELGTRLAQSATEIVASVWSSEQGKEVIDAQASLTKEGLTIKLNETADSSSRLTGDGLLVLKQIGNDNYVVAKFTKDESYTNNLTVATYLRFGAHRWEAEQDDEWDGVTTVGTGVYWMGPQEELKEATSGGE